jgi:hypothetical protein
MAIFAPANISGYRDPMQAATIKALEQRQKDLLAQSAAEPAITPENTQTPIQGFGHLANALGDQFRQGRAAAATSAARDRLAANMAGIDWEKGPTAQQIAGLSADPELMKSVLTTMAENRRNAATIAAEAERQKALFGHQDTAQAGLFGHQDAAAAEAARVAASAASDTAAAQTERDRAKEREATIAAAQLAENQAKEKRAEEAAKEAAAVSKFERDKTLPDTDLAKLTQLLGRPPTEAEVKASIEQLTAKKPSELKLAIDERDKAVELQSHLQLMDEAHSIINSPKGIHSGNALMTPLKTGIGTVLPQSLGGPDDETQKNTQRFNLIMKSEGLQQLLKMKGASSDRDVQENFKIANDPSQPLDSRKTALSLLRDAVYTHVKRNREDIEKMGIEYPKLERAPGSNAPDPNAAARKWLADPANAGNPDFEAVRRKVEGK